MPPRRRILVTSALPYVNGAIHLGHLLEAIQTDIWVRFQKMRGHEAWYVCADDTHGAGTMLRAEALGTTPEAMIEGIRAEHAADYRAFLVEHDNYYTTHSDENRQRAEEIYLACRAGGAIGTRAVAQLYDVERGMFLADRFVKGNCPKCGAADQYGDNCDACSATYDALDLKAPRSLISGSVPEVRESTHYFFELDQFQQFLATWTRSGTLAPAVANKIAEWIEPGLKPWDISRDAPYFGFRIPDTDDKYFYVWLDAPIGYMASFQNLAARTPGLDFDTFWRPGHATEVHHFIGKDIVNFHTLFWPAMLQCAGFRTPTRVHVHGFITVNGARMSKSRGTFINAGTFIQHVDPEALRYYYATKLGDSVDDMDIGFDDMVARVNSDLVGKVVNIASRCAGFIHRLAGGRLSGPPEGVEAELWQRTVAAGDRLAGWYEQGEYGRATREIMALADAANQYISEQAPWTLAKVPGNEARVAAVCTLGINLFRVLMVYLKPVLPAMAHKVEQFLAVPPLAWDDHRAWLGDHAIAAFQPLMQRLDPAQIERVIEASREAPGAAPADGPAPAAAKPSTAAGPAAEQTAAPAPAGSTDTIDTVDTIDIDTFAKVQLRVGKVIEAGTVDGADKLLRLQVDLGDHTRQIFAGIRSAYRPEQLVGRHVVVVANLAPRKMRFGVSEGMVLAAGPGGGDIFLVSPDDGAVPGMEVR